MSSEAVARVQCSGCQATFKLKSAGLGKNVKCPKCQTIFKAIAIQQTAPVGQPANRSPVVQVAAPGNQVAAGAVAAPPGTKRCDWCHEYIAIAEFDAHYDSHRGKREDGQLNTYPSLPPEERWKGDLSTVPQDYVHPDCGAVTGMPEDIIRTYLVNPYFYGYSSFCCGCGTHISGKKLKWVDTGETLYDYTKRLQQTNPDSAKYRGGIIKTFFAVSLIGGVVLGALVGVIGYFASGMMTGLVSGCIGTLLGALGTFGYLLKLRGGI